MDRRTLKVSLIIAAVIIAAIAATAAILYQKGRIAMIVDDEYNQDICSITGGEADTFTTAHGKSVSIFSIKHGSLAIHAVGKWIYVDPVSKAVEPVTDFTEMPDADLILITHAHPDHLDTLALNALESGHTKIVSNPAGAAVLGNGCTVMRNGDGMEAIEGITVEAVPAYNRSPEKGQFHPEGRDNGYVITVDRLRIYVAGDTEDIPELADLKDIDIAFLPCNLPFTMTPEQFDRAARMVRPKVLFPYHFGDTDIKKAADLLKDSGIDVRIRNYR